MSTIQERLRGSIVPVVSPFDNQNQLDVKTLRRLIDWLIAEGSHGISVGGTTGEPAALSIDERRLLMKTAMDAVGGRVPVLL
ncbi:MAG: dihydrodipicolinate synthase family protein, partial [Firmicutes bacterium]|nr:dihydrodipicolinate synthase family protein [Bacillota bacterium]